MIYLLILFKLIDIAPLANIGSLTNLRLAKNYAVNKSLNSIIIEYHIEIII